MTAEILAFLARSTVVSSIAILVVLALRPIVRSAFGTRIAYAFWLLIPVTLLASALPGPRYDAIIDTPPLASAIKVERAVAAVLLPLPPQSATQASRPRRMGVAAAVAATWAAGVLFSLGVLLLSQRRYVAKLRLRRPSGDTRVRYAEAEHASPAVVGLLRPFIVLPLDFERRYTAPERRLILAHERAHIEAWDAQVNALMSLIQCVYWFNPLFHVARRAFRMDQEFACDERVMQRHGDARRVYGEAMLKTQMAVGAMPLACHWPRFEMKSLKRRIAMLAQSRPSKARRATGATLCAGLVMATAAMTWAAQPQRAALAADRESATPRRGETAAEALGKQLVAAVRDQDEGAVRKLLDAGADVNHLLRGKGTPLIVAIREGNHAIVSLLVKAGADVNLSLPGDGSPLIAAATRGDVALINLMISLGANVNGYVRNDATPLVAAIRHGNSGSVAALLDADADVNFPAPGDGNPLIAAASRGDVALVEDLIARGAQVNGIVPGDETPLINAAQNNHLDAARALIARGADVNLTVETTLRDGTTVTRSPLSEAHRRNRDEMVQLLKSHGAR
jgi:beta-lactamase regulating signal transducer with metallopeptidase domain/ankyrin repeat protein